MLPKVWPTVLTLGWILVAIALGEALMALMSLALGDGLAINFGVTAAVTLVIAGACILTTKGRAFDLRFRDAALLTVVAWVVVPAFAALPLVAKPIGLSAIDAYFEAVSGLTTTGATVMSGLDELPPTILLWRSTMQWIGGVGIIGLAIVILPFLRIGGLALFRLESSDSSDKTMPRLRSIAIAVVAIYLAMTVASFFAYWSFGMSPFDALNHAFTTVCTGGYSTRDRSFAAFDSAAIEWTAIVFMIGGAVPFLAYLRIFKRGPLFRRVEPQILVFLAGLVVFSGLLAAWLIWEKDFTLAEALTKAVFNVVAIVTTTGYASADYVAWGPFAAMLVFLMSFLGGCTGSTTGGIKTFRFQILFAVAVQHIRRIYHPHAISPLRYGERVVDNDQASSVGTFIFLFLMSFALLTILLSLLGLDAGTALSAAIAAVGNIGPGVVAEIGPSGTYQGLPEAAKILLSFAMIMGRLEILSLLILFMPSFYR
ncbi:MAG: TrkH family potassium uptake protein [Alphaproteobacteria bacterium]